MNTSDICREYMHAENVEPGFDRIKNLGVEDNLGFSVYVRNIVFLNFFFQFFSARHSNSRKKPAVKKNCQKWNFFQPPLRLTIFSETIIW